MLRMEVERVIVRLTDQPTLVAPMFQVGRGVGDLRRICCAGTFGERRNAFDDTRGIASD